MSAPKRFDNAVAAVLEDPEKFKKDLRAKVKRENPKLTEEQVDAAMEQLAHQFGL